MSPREGWIAVGKVTNAHGVHGEVSVLPLTEVGARFEEGSRLFAGEEAVAPLTVKASRPHRGRLLVTFREVADRDSAAGLRGQYLLAPAGSSPELPEGRFWPHQLVGCEVVTLSGAHLGTLREILHTPANDVWIAAREGAAEVLVPAIREVVKEVDLEGRRIVVAEVPGLVEP